MPSARSTSSSRVGEIAIGLALILGLATRFAGVAGVVMMALFYVANWSFADGPVQRAVHVRRDRPRSSAYVGAGEYYGLDALIEKTPFVKRSPSAVAAFLH